jgi:Secretion system C-terminal sorting domain
MNKFLVYITIALTLIFSDPSFSQTLDLLKDFVPGKRIIFSFKRDGFPTNFYPDTYSRFYAFNGNIEVTTDSIFFSQTDSIKYYYLTIRKTGIETVLKTNKTALTKEIDSKYGKIIKEYLNVNYKNAHHQLSGWIFPDTAERLPVCKSFADSDIIYHHYPNYYRYYSFPATNTHDFNADSLYLSDSLTDCLDNGYYWDFVINKQGGLIEIETYLYNWFDWSIKEHYEKTNVTTVTENDEILKSYFLYPNYPNPFNPVTHIKYLLAKPGYIKLEIFNILGKSVKVLFNGYQTTGLHYLTFNAVNFSNGVYLISLQTNGFIQSRKMLLLK